MFAIFTGICLFWLSLNTVFFYIGSWSINNVNSRGTITCIAKTKRYKLTPQGGKLLVDFLNNKNKPDSILISQYNYLCLRKLSIHKHQNTIEIYKINLHHLNWKQKMFKPNMTISNKKLQKYGLIGTYFDPNININSKHSYIVKEINWEHL